MNGFKTGLVAVTVAAALGVVAPLSGALADTVTITDNSWYGDSGITVYAAGDSYSGYPIGPQQVTIGTGPTAYTVNAWCIDFNHDIGVPGTYTYNLVPFTPAGLASVSGNLSTPQPAALATNQTLINEIAYLMQLGNALLAPAANNDIASAIQIAIWQEEYPTTISYSGESLTVYNDIQSYLSAAAANSSKQWAGDALISSYEGTQQLAFGLLGVVSQNFTQVPEPASLVILGSALIGFGVIRRRRKSV